MSRISEVQDLLAEARNCVECIWLAAEALAEKAGPIQIVADMAVKKIEAAIALLDEYRQPADAPDQASIGRRSE